jgi:hypothetical protein
MSAPEAHCKGWGGETVEQLLLLTEADLSPLSNCGRKTIATIVKLQEDHGKEPEKPQEKPASSADRK